MNSPNPRPTLLIVEPEPLQALSVRKLVMETAKFNVITAHSTPEALALFNLFPKVSAAIVAAGDGVDCSHVADEVKKSEPNLPVIFLSAHIGARCPSADYHLSSHDPQELLNLMRSLLGDPRELQN